jgi:hypothetical protein
MNQCHPAQTKNAAAVTPTAARTALHTSTTPIAAIARRVATEQALIRETISAAPETAPVSSTATACRAIAAAQSVGPPRRLIVTDARIVQQ